MGRFLEDDDPTTAAGGAGTLRGELTTVVAPLFNGLNSRREGRVVMVVEEVEDFTEGDDTAKRMGLLPAVA